MFGERAWQRYPSLASVGTASTHIVITRDSHRRHRTVRRVATAVAAVCLTSGVVSPHTADAQQTIPMTRDSVGAVAEHRVRTALLTRSDLLVGGMAIAATAAVAPFDRRSAAFMQAPRLQRMSDLQHAARDAAFMGGPGPFLLGATLFAGGHLTGSQPVADVGLHLTESLVLAAGINGFVKGLSGRALPLYSADPANLEFGRGFRLNNGAYVSFPSGHTAAAFAMAAVLTGEAGRLHPGASRFVGPFAYGGAALIGVARMYQNVHWASDLPIAALIGTWSGMTVVSHQHSHPHNRLDRWLLSTGVAPSGRGGVMLAWSTSMNGATR